MALTRSDLLIGLALGGACFVEFPHQGIAQDSTGSQIVRVDIYAMDWGSTYGRTLYDYEEFKSVVQHEIEQGHSDIYEHATIVRNNDLERYSNLERQRKNICIDSLRVPSFDYRICVEITYANEGKSILGISRLCDTCHAKVNGFQCPIETHLLDVVCKDLKNRRVKKKIKRWLSR